MLQVRAATRGFEEAIAALQKRSQLISGPVLLAAAQVGASIVEEEVLIGVPVYTGRLKRSIGTGVGIEQDGLVRIYIGPREGYAEWERGRLQDPEVYGEIVEEIGSPIGRGQDNMVSSAQRAMPRVRDAVAAIIRAALENA